MERVQIAISSAAGILSHSTHPYRVRPTGSCHSPPPQRPQRGGKLSVTTYRLVLKQKLISIKQCPTNVFDAPHGVRGLATVIYGRFQLDIGRRATERR